MARANTEPINLAFLDIGQLKALIRSKSNENPTQLVKDDLMSWLMINFPGEFVRRDPVRRPEIQKEKEYYPPEETEELISLDNDDPLERKYPEDSVEQLEERLRVLKAKRKRLSKEADNLEMATRNKIRRLNSWKTEKIDDLDEYYDDPNYSDGDASEDDVVIED